MYGLMGCVVRPVVGRGGGGGMKVEGKGKDGRAETTRLKKICGIKSGGGLLSSFVLIRGSVVWKSQHHRFSLWGVFFVSP